MFSKPRPSRIALFLVSASLPIAAASADEATLIVAFIGHAEAVRDRLYLLPRDGTVLRL